MPNAISKLNKINDNITTKVSDTNVTFVINTIGIAKTACKANAYKKPYLNEFLFFTNN